MKKLIKAIFKLFGYRIKKIDADYDLSYMQAYNRYEYRKEDGSFDYVKYKQAQIEGNKRKINNIWVREENIQFLSDYIKKIVKQPKFGLCHGTRRGKEQEWFIKYLAGCEVIGTEISDTAINFPHTIQWDFHETKPEWINSMDFIYSNSFDHSYDPEKCLNVWMSCIKKDGICILEHSSLDEAGVVSELDPFGASLAIMPYLILTWGKGNYGMRELLRAPVSSDNLEYLYFIIIQKFY